MHVERCVCRKATVVLCTSFWKVAVRPVSYGQRLVCEHQVGLHGDAWPAGV